ncbi:MAG: CDP-alcohol phosphatidyltransferase family protein [Candidatus Pacearchaeota archaeon]
MVKEKGINKKNASLNKNNNLSKINKKLKEESKKFEKEIKKEFILNVPNTITLIRLIFAFILGYMILFNYNNILIGVLFAFAAISDWFDGFFARRLNQKTELGARLDQVIDRVFMIPLVLILMYKFYYTDKNMAYLLVICLSREIVAFPGFVVRIIRNLDSYKVKYIGKVTTFIQSIAIGAIIFNLPGTGPIILILSIATGLIGLFAGFDYLRDSFL